MVLAQPARRMFQRQQRRWVGACARIAACGYKCACAMPHHACEKQARAAGQPQRMVAQLEPQATMPNTGLRTGLVQSISKPSHPPPLGGLASFSAHKNKHL